MTPAARFDPATGRITVQIGRRVSRWSVRDAADLIEQAPRFLIGLARKGHDFDQREWLIRMEDGDTLKMPVAQAFPLVAALAPALDAACRAGVCK